MNILKKTETEKKMCNKFIRILYQIENKNPCHHISCVYSLSSYKKYDRHLNTVLIISNLTNLILIQRNITMIKLLNVLELHLFLTNKKNNKKNKLR